MPATAQQLKDKLKRLGEAVPEKSRVRLHRAISWLKRAEQEEGDHDARFIFLWIAFNAAYAREFGFEKPERDLLKGFLAALVKVDDERLIQKVVFEQFTGPVRLLIDNKYVFDPFWRALRDHDGSNEWGMRFEQDKRAALRSVMSNDTVKVLGVIFDRLYVLRNQLVHGGATWNGKVNRRQGWRQPAGVAVAGDDRVDAGSSRDGAWGDCLSGGGGGVSSMHLG
ncbi:MAG TPA: hypothetical protein VM240_09985 [Verrucomicrobiae bacterium]|nr:hypothetical protein [Verrucomicrobiae bacterium]